jgi:hypothetical protein
MAIFLKKDDHSAGSYEIKLMVWSSLEHPHPLTESTTRRVSSL